MSAKKVVRIPIRQRERTELEVEKTEDDVIVEGVSPQLLSEDSGLEPEPDVTPVVEVQDAAVDWRDQALRLRADMDNYRRRQQRLAEDQIAQAKAALLLKYLGVLDSLERVVAHLRPDDAYDQSVRVTYDQMLKVLRSEGVEPIAAVGEPFDPAWHEAVAMVSAPDHQKEDLLVIDEEQRGYCLGEQLLRPARVIVAKK